MTVRSVLSPGELVKLYGARGVVRGPVDDELFDRIVAAAAAIFEIGDDEEKLGLALDAGVIAAELGLPIGVRRLAALVSLAARSALDKGFTDWDIALDYVIASEDLYHEGMRRG